MNLFAFRNREIFYMDVTDICRIAVEVDDDSIQQVGRICFVMNFFYFLFNNTLNHIGVLQFDSYGCGYFFTGNQSLEVQSHQLFLNWIIINVLYQGIDFFAFDVQINLSSFFICFNEFCGLGTIELKCYWLFHFFSTKNSCDVTLTS